MDTWYWAPYPAPYGACKKLYICEYTLKYFRKKSTLLRHTAKLSRFHPPGDEIYRSPSPGGGADSTTVSGAVTNPPIAVFEVDGRKNKVSGGGGWCGWCVCVGGWGSHASLGCAYHSLAVWWCVQGGLQGPCHPTAHQATLPPLLPPPAPRCTARTCACCPSCSWTTRRSTTTWTPSCSTCCARWTTRVGGAGCVGGWVGVGEWVGRGVVG